jgi:hypothetical protein
VRIVLVIPLPSKDVEDRIVSARRRKAAADQLLVKLGAWFGSATLLPSWGTWKSSPGSSLSIDKGQAVLLVVTDSTSYRRRGRRSNACSAGPAGP